MTQLAAFRALRQAQKRTADLNAQLARVELDTAQQHHAQELQAQTLVDLLAGAREQIARLEATLQETQAGLQVQAAAATARCEAAAKRAAAAEELLAAARADEGTKRAELELTRQEHLLELCEVRATAYAQVEAARQSGAQAGRAEAQQQLTNLAQDRDRALRATEALRQALAVERMKLSESEAQLAKAKEGIRKFTQAVTVPEPAGPELSGIAVAAKAAVAVVAAVLTSAPRQPTPAPPSSSDPPPTQSITITRRYGKLDGGSSR